MIENYLPKTLQFIYTRLFLLTLYVYNCLGVAVCYVPLISFFTMYPAPFHLPYLPNFNLPSLTITFDVEGNLC
mgnify:FL=1